MTLDKYVKPKSVTWWVAVVQLLLGLIIATEPLHGLSTLVGVVDEVTGGVGAYALLSVGLGGIGIRGAIG